MSTLPLGQFVDFTLRYLLVELLNDIVDAAQKTPGCHKYVRDAENLSRLRNFATGSRTRWNFFIDVANRLQPATRRWELLITYLLHSWLVAEGRVGLSVPAPAGGEDASSTVDVPTWVLSSADLGDKIKMLKNTAHQQLLAEMCNPSVRVWIIFLECYGKASVQPFLSYTMNDNLGVACKAARVIRSRIWCLTLALALLSLSLSLRLALTLTLTLTLTPTPTLTFIR